MQPIEVPRLEYSEDMRFGSRPGVVLSTSGASWFNMRAASLLELKHGDVIALYRFQDRWFIGNDPEIGTTVGKSRGLYKFCDTKKIKILFESLNVPGRRASFFLGSELEPFSNTKALLINPNFFNVK